MSPLTSFSGAVGPRLSVLLAFSLLLGLVPGAEARQPVRGYSRAAHQRHRPAVDARAPSAPTGLTVAKAATTRLRITWRAADDDVGVVGYSIHVGHRLLGRVRTHSYLVTKLTCGTPYVVSVLARDAAGHRSSRARVRTTTAPCRSAQPAAPAPVTTADPPPAQSPPVTPSDVPSTTGTPAPSATPSPSPTATPAPTAAPSATPSPATGTVFNTAPLFTTLNHTQFGTYDGTTQACDLTGRTGYLAGTDHAISFVSGGVTFSGCYSINQQVGATPPGGGKRPAVFVFGPGTPRKSSTSQEVANAGNQPLGIIDQGKQAGWDMIYMGLFGFTDTSSPWNFTYDQVYADYTKAVIADLETNHNIDPTRLYAFGTSAGGRVPSFLACHLSDEFAAIVAQGGAIHGPGISSGLAVDHCGRPSNPVSTMYVFADGAQLPDGQPAEDYAVHITPTHTTLTPADVADITTGSPSQIYYAMQHVGETWAYWNGCAGQLVGHDVQSVTVGIAPNTSPGTKLWQWTGCQDDHGGTSGAVDLYILHGPHGIEPQVQDDGSAYRFLQQHPG